MVQRREKALKYKEVIPVVFFDAEQAFAKAKADLVKTVLLFKGRGMLRLRGTFHLTIGTS